MSGSKSIHLPPVTLRKEDSGVIFEYYQTLIPWLQLEEHTEDANKLPWKPLTEGWKPKDTERLWRPWGRLLPLFVDATVEEIFVQKIPRHPTDPTPTGFLDVLSDGSLGMRLHRDLRISEKDFTDGLERIATKQGHEGLYSTSRPEGKVVVQSALELDGCRLASGIPPASTAPFAAIRIPARERPNILHLVGARRFGANVDKALICPGEPLPIPMIDPIGEARAALDGGDAEGSVMFPIESLEYLRCTSAVGWNVVYSGATSSAKTTTLNAAISLLPAHWRVVTVESGVAELKIPHINWVPLFVSDTVKDLSQENLVKLAMRMSPKPIPNGEIRSGNEIALWAEITLTGHECSPTTLHAGSADEALMRLAVGILSGTEGGLTEETARIKAAMAANVVVQLAREEVLIDGVVKSVRRCTSISEVQVTGSYIAGDLKIAVVPVFETRQDTSGNPYLAYVGHQSDVLLWPIMRKRFKEKEIPEWAKLDQVMSCESKRSLHSPPLDDQQ